MHNSWFYTEIYSIPQRLTGASTSEAKRQIWWKIESWKVQEPSQQGLQTKKVYEHGIKKQTKKVKSGLDF